MEKKRDIILYALEAGWQRTENKKLANQEWNIFEYEVIGKKLFLFGCGDGAEYFCNRYGKRYVMEGIVDNDNKKQGLDIDDFIMLNDRTLFKNTKVLSCNDLKIYEQENIILLITSLKYYEAIAEQLEKEGIDNYFAMLPMEEKQRALKQTEDIDTGTRIESDEFPIEDKKIIFYTMGGYSGHGKAIAEELLKQREDLDIVWVVDDMTVKVPEGIRLVYRKNKSRYIQEMSTAKCWIDDYLIPLHVSKRFGQFFIEVKHWSSITLKSFGFGLYEFRKDAKCLEMCKHNSEMMDYIFVGSKFDEDTCRQGFDFHGEVVYIGSPRSDVLFQGKQVKDKIYNLYNVEKEYRLALFAPTFRCGKGEKKTFEVADMDLDFCMLKRELEKKFGGFWIILLRLHPNVAIKSKLIARPEYVIDVSDYAESEELVAASDVMITDYSSIMFEPAFVNKPVFLYAPDREEYINTERELLIDYDTLPFPIAESNEELAQKISEFDNEEYVQKITNFLGKYDIHEDGNASVRAAKFIINLICR